MLRCEGETLLSEKPDSCTVHTAKKAAPRQSQKGTAGVSLIRGLTCPLSSTPQLGVDVWSGLHQPCALGPGSVIALRGLHLRIFSCPPPPGAHLGHLCPSWVLDHPQVGMLGFKKKGAGLEESSLTPPGLGPCRPDLGWERAESRNLPLGPDGDLRVVNTSPSGQEL